MRHVAATHGMCLASLVAGGTAPAFAGDYGLTIADDPTSACAGSRFPRSPSWPVVSGAGIAADVVRYFSGEEPHTTIFRAAFGNAFVTFCGGSERRAVYAAMIAMAVQGPTSHAEHLYDFALSLGSNRLIGMLDDELGKPGLDPKAAARLRRMRANAETGMRVRHEGGAAR
jgi:hypothetical protein